MHFFVISRVSAQYFKKFLSNSFDLMKNLFSKSMAIHGFSSTKKNTELQVKFRYSEKAIKIWLTFHFFLLLLKGQEFLKPNCQAVNSSDRQAFSFFIFCQSDQGPFSYYVRTQGWVGGPENGNFPLLYVVKMSLRRWVGGPKKPQNTLT